jgi:hypothetical protein
MAADVDTRAPLDEYGGFEEGTAAERAIKTAYFFFFDAIFLFFLFPLYKQYKE